MLTSGGVFMSSDESIRYQIISKFLAGSINREEAAKLLQISERTVSRIASKVKDRGVFGVKHGNLGKTPSNKFPDELKETVINLLCSKYFDFNVKHFHEVLVSEFNIPVSYRTLWDWCKKMKLVKNPRVKRRKKREYRHRMPSEGLLLQMDGCHHKFNGKDEWCLIAAIDDATSEIPYAEFFEGETTQACLKVLKRIIETKGLPKAIYTDRAGWSGGGKRVNFSQFKRACDELGIQVIFANSPEGKGRIERSFRTIQDRLIPELRINKAKTLQEANAYLHDKFLKGYWNKEKTVVADNPESAYSPPNPFLDLNLILTIEENRKISSDQTTTWKNQRYKVIGSVGYGSYEATFKTDFDGNTRVFVRGQEVTLEPISEPVRAEDLNSQPEPMGLTFMHYAHMWRVIGDLRNAVVQHQVSGKPLKFGRQKKAS